MSARFVTWFLPKSLYSPACLLSLAVRVCLGFVHGAEISAGRSPLMVEDLLWGKLGLLYLKPRVVAGSVLCDMMVLLWLFGSSVMGTVMASVKHGFYKERFVALQFAAPSVSGWKNLSVDGKSRKQ